MNLQVTEIYKSVQGESSWAGLPCTFIRLTGCPLRCRWCDTVYSFKGGKTLSFEEIYDQVEKLETPLIEFTGGEPLAQDNVKGLITLFLDRGFQVLIETSGSLPIEHVDKRACLIMDIKCPDSKMSDKNYWENIKFLKKTDEIKFVVASREDFDWAIQIVEEHQLKDVCSLLFSPAWGLVEPKDLVSWILEKKIWARLNLQQHKYIWSPKAKGV